MICSLNLLEALAKYLDKTKCVGNLEDPSGLSLNLTGILCWVAWLASLTWDLIPCLHVKVSDIKDAGGGWRSVMFFPLAPYLLPASAVCRWRPGEDDDDYSSCQSEGKLISWVVTFKMFFIFTPTGIWGRWIFFKWAETINYIVTVSMRNSFIMALKVTKNKKRPVLTNQVQQWGRHVLTGIGVWASRGWNRQPRFAVKNLGTFFFLGHSGRSELGS